jgi:superfamily II DNA or RNA helicase
MNEISLYPYQQEAAVRLAEAVTTYGSALDASDTGVGKTYVALGVAQILGLPPLIVSPKSVITSWRNAAAALGVEPIAVVNVEKLKAGRQPYLKRSGKTFVWNLPRGSLVIWDECQNASGYKSQNGKVLAYTKAYGLKTLCLSATCADSPLKMRALGYLLGLHAFKDHYDWCLRHGCYKNPWGALEYVKSESISEIHMRAIHHAIFPKKGNRIRIQELDVFPENAIFADAYDLDSYTDAVNEIYARMGAELQDPEMASNPLTVMLRAGQAAELCKVPLLVDLATESLDEEKSVVVFVNFRDTLVQLTEALARHSPRTIYGGQAGDERDAAIAAFQADSSRVMVAMIQAGGVGVSLHDLNGKHPRVSLISPTFNAVQLKQALGRIHRAGGRTKCVQRLVFAAGTVEEKACKAVRKKLNNIARLNDGDLSCGFMPETETDDGDKVQ